MFELLPRRALSMPARASQHMRNILDASQSSPTGCQVVATMPQHLCKSFATVAHHITRFHCHCRTCHQSVCSLVATCLEHACKSFATVAQHVSRCSHCCRNVFETCRQELRTSCATCSRRFTALHNMCPRVRNVVTTCSEHVGKSFATDVKHVFGVHSTAQHVSECSQRMARIR